MSKIYHYTSIESLALILKNKTIRFSRLDKVDDIEESCYLSGPTKTNMGQYIFVSCWTREQAEILPMWKMYTDYQGVRICFDEDLFIVKDETYGVEREFFVLPDQVKDCELTLFQNEAKLQEVHYVENVEQEINKLIEVDSEDKIRILFRNAGIYKRKDWEFQKEHRFKIVVTPIANEKFTIGLSGNLLFNFWEEFMKFQYNNIKCMIKNIPIKETYIDIPFNPNILKTMEITLGPRISTGGKEIVEELLDKYKDIKVYNSIFHGKIRR